MKETQPEEFLPPPQTGPFFAWLAFFLIFLTAFFIYSNTFSVPFLYDDQQNILDNPKVHSLALFDLFGNRSVGFLSFALNYAAGGTDVFGYHLVNLLIHAANGCLVYALVLLLMRAARSSALVSAPWIDLGIALATALLFVAHPVQTQAVTYIVQRLASQVALFYLLSVVGYLKWRLEPSEDRWRWAWYLLSLVACVLAMKTKENAFTIPFMILLMESVFFRPVDGIRWTALIPFFLTLPIIPLSFGKTPGDVEFAQQKFSLSRTEYLFTQFRVVVTYLRLLILPIRQNVDYDYPAYRSFSEVWPSFILLASLLGFALTRLRSGLKLAAFGVVWFFLTLSIESSIFPIQDVMFEHRLYLPSVGLLWAFSLWVLGWGRGTKGRAGTRRLVVLSLVVLILGGAAYRRNFVWADDLTLWQDVVLKAPHNAKAHHNLGTALATRGRLQDAKREYEEAIRLYHDYAEAHKNLGNVHMMLGQTQDAIERYQEALRISPGYQEARRNLEIARKKLGSARPASP